MFRVYKQVSETAWKQAISIEMLWTKWDMESLWNREIVERSDGVWTMSLPEGHTVVKDPELAKYWEGEEQ